MMPKERFNRFSSNLNLIREGLKIFNPSHNAKPMFNALDRLEDIYFAELTKNVTEIIEFLQGRIDEDADVFTRTARDNDLILDLIDDLRTKYGVKHERLND